MSLDNVLNTMGSQLHELTVYLWKDDTRSLLRLEDRAHRLSRELTRGVEGLVRQRAILEELRAQAAEAERREAFLVCRVETYLHVSDRTNAWRHALDLDQARESLARLREQLRREEEAYADSRTALEEIKQQLAGIRDQIRRQRRRC